MMAEAARIGSLGAGSAGRRYHSCGYSAGSVRVRFGVFSIILGVSAGLTLAVVAAVGLATASAADDGLPPGYSRLGLDEAMAEAQREGRLLVVGATAAWSEPCKRMDESTWRDERVAQWVKANAVAIKVDVDQDRDTAARLRVGAVPTTLVFRQGELFDRVTGYRDASSMLEWLERAEAGRTSAERLRELIGERPEPEALNVFERVAVIERLRRDDRLDDLYEELRWLREVLSQEAYREADSNNRFEVVWSRLSHDTRELVRTHEPLSELIGEVRDDYQRRLEVESDRFYRETWIEMNNALRDDQRTLGWIDSIMTDEEATRMVREKGLLTVLRRVLVEHERWEAYGALIRERDAASEIENTARWLGEEKRRARARSEDDFEAIMEPHYAHAREWFGRMHATLLAAERDALAWTIVEQLGEVIEDDGAFEAEMVEWAQRIGAIRPRHFEILDASNPKHKEHKDVLRLLLDGP